jgi:hypothetical protein
MRTAAAERNVKIGAALARRCTRRLVHALARGAPNANVRGPAARQRYVTVSRAPCSAERSIASQTSAAR